jgi:hypothetical protein
VVVSPADAVHGYPLVVLDACSRIHLPLTVFARAARRDAARARQRYVRWDRPALAERLVALEHAYADLEQRFARTTSELLTWMVITARVCALYAQSDQTIHKEFTA